MRWFLNLAAIGCLLAGIGLFIALQQSQESSYAQMETRFGEILLRSNRSAAEHLEKSVNLAEQNAKDALKKAHKREISDASFLAQGMPKFIYSADHKVRAPDFLVEPELLSSVKSALGQKQKISLAKDVAKHYLYLSGNYEAEGESLPFVAVFDLENFFNFLRTSDGTVHWLATKDAEIIYHSQARFWGADASNFKPLAEGLHSLSEGRNSTILSSYLGLEGNESFGASGTIPRLGLILGSEWPSFSARFDRSNNFVAWGSFLFLALGFFLFGLSLRGKKSEKREESYFDSSRLDAETMEYLENAQRSNEEAMALMKEKDKTIIDLEEIIRRQVWQLKDVEWKLSVLDSFQDRCKTVGTGKQVWRELAKVIAERVPGAYVIYYRYSITSFSLVPELSVGMESLDENARRYLEDARMFIGNFSQVDQLEGSEAFRKWNRLRQHQMPLSDLQMHFLPIDGMGGSGRGCIAILLEKSLNENSVNREFLEFFHELIRRASWLYDSSQPLVQSKDAKRDGASSLASKTNGTRNQSSNA